MRVGLGLHKQTLKNRAWELVRDSLGLTYEQKEDETKIILGNPKVSETRPLRIWSGQMRGT